MLILPAIFFHTFIKNIFLQIITTFLQIITTFLQFSYGFHEEHQMNTQFGKGAR